MSTGEWIDQLQLRQVLKLWQQQALQELGNPRGFFEGDVVMWGFGEVGDWRLGRFRVGFGLVNPVVGIVKVQKIGRFACGRLGATTWR